MGLFSKIVSSVSGQGKRPQVAPVKNSVLCGRYAVTGKNPETGRKKTVSVIAEEGLPLEVLHEKSGLLPPFEVSQKPLALPPTDNQLKYAEKLGFSFPPDATSLDASVFLSRAEAGQPIVQPGAPAAMVRYVIERGITVPAYAGAAEVSAFYLRGCSDSERAAFFCMRVFCNITGKSYGYLENATQWEQDVFREFSGLYGSDKEFLRSLGFYSAEDLPLGSCPQTLKRIKAYEIAAVYLKMKGAVK